MSTVVITGTNRGIGLSFVKRYLSRGDTVYALCREPSPALSDSGATVVSGIDVSSEDVAQKIRTALTGVSVDILINNAGIFENENLGDIEYGAIHRQFEVNAVAPLRVAEALLPQLSNTAKIAMITSRMGSIADNGSGAYYGYRMSKAALNAASKSLANDVKDKGVSVAILHPGYVATDMVNNSGDISPDTAAERLVQRIDELNLENTGSFWHSNGEILPW